MPQCCTPQLRLFPELKIKPAIASEICDYASLQACDFAHAPKLRTKQARYAAQDGRKLRRYKLRWMVERTIGWLGNLRRLVVRHDRSLTIYGAFFHDICFVMVLRTVLQCALCYLCSFVYDRRTSLSASLPCHGRNAPSIMRRNALGMNKLP